MAVTVSSLKKGSGQPIWFQLQGLVKLQRALEDLNGTDLDEEMEQAVQEELDEVLAESKELCPVDTGRLRDSAFTGVSRKNGVIVGAVGYDTPYALYVHENPDAYHKPPTQWKFLEEPLMKAQPRFAARIAARFRSYLKKKLR